MSGRYALLIANTTYADPGLAQLMAPGRDAEEFARVLRSPDIGAFDDVKTLEDAKASALNEAIDEFFSAKKPEDLLVLYFSGHGVRDEFGSLYLAVHNTKRALLPSTAIEADFIRKAMDRSRSRRQVLILDCCNSGAFAQGTKAEIGGSIGTASAFEGTGHGRIILTASDATQFAWEGDKVIGEASNSLFTHFLVKGLEGDADQDGDGKITVDELYDYTYEQIVNITPRQTPGKWSYKQQGEIVLRQITRMQDIKPISLPEEIVHAIESPLPYVREGAAQQLAGLLTGRNLGMARSARDALERMAAEDDSYRVRQAVSQVLEPFHKAEQKAEEERVAAEAAAREQAAREAAEREEGEGKSPVVDAALIGAPVLEEVESPEAMDSSGAQMTAGTPEMITQEAVERDARRAEGDRKTGTEPSPERYLPRWVAVFWIALGWAIGVAIAWSSVLVTLTDMDPGVATVGAAIGGAISGAIGGLGTSVVLRRERTLSDWDGMLKVTASWILGVGAGWAIVVVIAQPIAQAIIALAIALAIAQAIGWAIGGLGTSMVVRRERTLLDSKGMLWVTAGWALGGPIGFFVLIFLDTRDLGSIDISSGVAGAIAGALAGAIGGSIMIWQLRKGRVQGSVRLAGGGD